MKSDLYHFLHDYLTIMDPGSFQWLCTKYLQDLGYECTHGPLIGRDGATDICGSGPNGPFSAHCTTTGKRHIKSKFETDILRSCAAKGANVHDAEIFLFSVNRIIAQTLALEQYKRDLVTLMSSLVPEYRSKPPAIHAVDGSMLVTQVLSIGKTGGSYQYLLGEQLRFKHEVEGIDYLDDSVYDSTSGIACTQEQFSYWVRGYRDGSSDSIHRDHLGLVAVHAWELIVHRPLEADGLVNELVGSGYISRSMQLVLHLHRNLARYASDVDVDQVASYLSLLRSAITRSDSESDTRLMLALTRMLRHLAYSAPLVLESPSILKELNHVAAMRLRFLDRFFTDLLLRHSCEFVSLPPRVVELLAFYFQTYARTNSNDSLIRVSDFVLEPLSAIRGLGSEQLSDHFRSFASSCQDVLGSRWVLLSFTRLIPLVYQWQDDPRINNDLRRILESFPEHVRRASPYLAYVELMNLLIQFRKRRDIQALGTYETLFRTYRSRIPAVALPPLQLEYAACICEATDFVDESSVGKLEFALDIYLGRSARIERLLANNFVAGSDLERLVREAGGASGEDIRHMAASYCKKLYDTFAAPRIRQRHLLALGLEAVARVHKVRPSLSRDICTSVRLNADSLTEISPGYAARSLALFDHISGPDRIGLMRKYLESSLRGDRLTLMRNAHHIASALYTLYYYSGTESQPYISDLTNKFAKTVSVRECEPKPYWAFLGGIFFSGDANEKAFVESVFFRCRHRKEKLGVERVSSHRGNGAVIPDAVLDLIRRFSLRHSSLIASALSACPSESETWNTMGTTVFNCEFPQTTGAALRSGIFYGVARALSRGRLQRDQKYCFNYIRAMSCASFSFTPPQLDEFVRDAADYLCQRRALYFNYKKECVRPFCDLLNRRWGDIDPQTREMLGSRLGSINWIDWRPPLTSPSWLTRGGLDDPSTTCIHAVIELRTGAMTIVDYHQALDRQITSLYDAN